jgi:hypothetical protein
MALLGSLNEPVRRVHQLSIEQDLSQQTGALGVKSPTRYQVLHGDGVVPGAQTMAQVQLMRFFDLNHV